MWIHAVSHVVQAKYTAHVNRRIQRGHFGSMGATQAAEWERDLTSWLCQSDKGTAERTYSIHTLGLTSWQCYGQKASLNYFHQLWLKVMADYFVRWFQTNGNNINIEKYIISCSQQGAQFLLSMNTRQTTPRNNILKQYHSRGSTVILNIIPDCTPSGEDQLGCRQVCRPQAPAYDSITTVMIFSITVPPPCVILLYWVHCNKVYIVKLTVKCAL